MYIVVIIAVKNLIQKKVHHFIKMFIVKINLLKKHNKINVLDVVVKSITQMIAMQINISMGK
jgi:hypothetical protein